MFVVSVNDLGAGRRLRTVTLTHADGDVVRRSPAVHLD